MTTAIEAGADLLPCPFCGEPPGVLENGWTVTIHCQNRECGCDVSVSGTERHIVGTEWNRRPAAIASGALVPASAVAEMRERCAKVADKYTASIDNDWNRSIGKADDMSATAEDIADIIRQLDTAPAAASRTGDTTT